MAHQGSSAQRGPRERGPRSVREGMESVFEGKTGPFAGRPGQHHGGGFANRPRSRGGKAPLSREAVVNAAIACLEAGGPDAVTMRAVARTLETGASSLYAHVANQRELYRLILERVAASVPPVPEALHGADAAEWLTLAIGRAYARFPGSAGLALSSSEFGDAGLDLFERMLEAVAQMGLEGVIAFRAVDTLNLLVTAAYAEADARAREENALGDRDMADVIARSETRHPRLESIVDAALNLSDAEMTHQAGVEWGVRTFLNGLRQ
jgi:AcrR family transcriptional regulator